MQSRVDWKESGQMLSEGYTFTEIADHFGVSKQFIQQYYTQDKRGYHRKRKNKVAYPAFEEWMKKSHATYASMARKMHTQTQRVRLIMIGKTKTISIDTIKKLSEITGMTFEEMFRDETEEAAEE